MAKYIYVYGKDVFDDNNNGLIWGVQTDDTGEEYVDVDYIEWYSSLNKLLEETKGMNITNRKQFLSRFKKTHKISKKSGKIRKIPKTRNKIMYYKDFEKRLSKTDLIYETEDLWDFQELYQNMAGFQENYKNFVNFISED